MRSVGDAFVTRNVINGVTGPQLFPTFDTDNEQALRVTGAVRRR
jgi:hypothetical protein